MLKALVVILGVVVILVAGVLVYAATKPDTFRVQRSLDIAAPPEKIFSLINDMRSFNTWNPYERKDPNKGTYSGPASGRGAAYAWESDKLGAGRMEIVDAASPSKVTLKLDFIRPFEAHNTADFIIAQKGNATNVTWAMYGPNVFIGKVMSVFMDFDKMVGKDFEEGLANLKAIAEK
jgi:hypothetical protein